MTTLELIEANKGLIYNAMSKFYNAEAEDLYQVGEIALLKAYKNYKDDGTTKFSTYAYKYIYGEIYLYVNNNKIIRQLLKLSFM